MPGSEINRLRVERIFHNGPPGQVAKPIVHRFPGSCAVHAFKYPLAVRGSINRGRIGWINRQTVDPIFSKSIILDLSLIHISEPTRLGMISYAVFCLKK